MPIHGRLLGRPDQDPRPRADCIVPGDTGAHDQGTRLGVLGYEFREPGKDQGRGAQAEVRDEVTGVCGADGCAGGVRCPERHCDGRDEADEGLGDDEGPAGAEGVGEDRPDPDEGYGYPTARDGDDVHLFGCPGCCVSASCLDIGRLTFLPATRTIGVG